MLCDHWLILYSENDTNALSYVGGFPCENPLDFIFTRFLLIKNNQVGWKRCFLSCHGSGRKEKVPIRKQTSDLWIPRSDVLPLSRRDLMLCKAHCAVQPSWLYAPINFMWDIQSELHWEQGLNLSQMLKELRFKSWW